MATSEIQIVCDAEAQLGATVAYQVGLHNIDTVQHTYHFEIYCPDTLHKILDRPAGLLNPNQWYSFSSTFVMPNRDAQIFVWVEVLIGGEYDYDTSHSRWILLSAPSPTEPHFRYLSVNIS